MPQTATTLWVTFRIGCAPTLVGVYTDSDILQSAIAQAHLDPEAKAITTNTIPFNSAPRLI